MNRREFCKSLFGVAISLMVPTASKTELIDGNIYYNPTTQTIDIIREGGWIERPKVSLPELYAYLKDNWSPEDEQKRVL